MLSRSASKQEIIKAYRKAAQKWHPDNFHGDEKKLAEKKFIDIAAAKEVYIILYHVTKNVIERKSKCILDANGYSEFSILSVTYTVSHLLGDPCERQK